MGFQSTVRLQQTSFIVGEIVFGGPLRAEPKILNSTAAANNVFGRAFQQIAGATNSLNVTADGGSAGVFAGIMVNPKEHVTSGTTAGTLEATLTLPNGENATFLKEGQVGVTLTNGAAVEIGDEIFYSFLTGELLAQTPGGNAPANHARVPNATVVRCYQASAGLVYIHLNG